MINVSREQLHEEIWTEPMTKVSVKYGISDVALKKICKKHEIPTPIQGHWAKLAAGKKVVKMKLPGSGTDMVTIQGNSSTVENMLSNCADLTGSVIQEVAIPDTLVPIAHLMKDRLENRKPSRDGLVALKQKSSMSISIKKEAIERTVDFIQKLIVIGQENGVKLLQGEKHLVLEIEDEKLSFSIHAKLEKETYILTPQEQSKLSEWKQKRKRLKNYSPRELIFHDYREPKFPKYTHFHSTALVIEIIDGQYSGIRRTFADGKVQRIEKMIGSILMTAKKHISYRLIKRKEREEDEIRRTLINRLREEQTKFRNLEKKRVAVFEESFTLWKNYEELQRFLAHARRVSNNNPQRSSEWLIWTEEYIETFNPFPHGVPELLEMNELSKRELKYG